jgi:hypothetical protein
MEDQIRGARGELPRRRPGHLVAGVIQDPGAAQLTVDELNANGFSEEALFVLHGERGADSLRHRGEAGGFLNWMWGRFVEFAGAGDDFVRRHIEAVEEGNYVIGVELKSEDSRTRDGVGHILKSHGGDDIAQAA